MSVPLPDGTWLVHDPEDVRRERDFSVWRRRPSQANATLLVDWFGEPGERHTDHWLPERMIWVHLTPAHLVQLEMAAHHGVFRQRAMALWAEIMR